MTNKHIKILIAEDELVARKILTSAVEKMGHVAIQCSNGQRAWEVLQDNPDIDLVITDMVMPDMDGRELIMGMRREQSLTNIPIVVVSGMVGADEIGELLDHNAVQFLAKPIDLSILKQYITRLVYTQATINSEQIHVA